MKHCLLVILWLGAIVSCQLAHKRGANTQAIISQFETKMGDAKECARVIIKELRTSFSGEITLRWSVNDKGETLDPQIVKNTTQSDAVGICWLNYLKRLKFEPTGFKSTATVEYTYEYTYVDN